TNACDSAYARARPANSSTTSGWAATALGDIEEHLRRRPARVELEAAGCRVGERMMEDVERPVALVEDELEVVVGRGVGDGDGHQVRRSAPEQRHRDAVALSRRQ